MILQKTKALTYLELILTVAIFMLLVGATTPPLVSLFFSNDVHVAKEEMVHVLRTAQERANTQIFDSAWGVRLDTGADTYTLFAGSTYAGRDTEHDLIYTLPNSVSFGTHTLTGGGDDVIFDQITGATSQDGTIELDSAQESTVTITINSFGHVSAD